MTEPSISVNEVTKTFEVRDDSGSQTIVAVDRITLQCRSGERVGIIGPNGAGKTTLLQMIAGIADPTSGSVVVSGAVTTIMTLGIGLRDEVSGRENIFLDGELHGRNRAEIAAGLDEIIAFADLGPFIDHPVKTYSTGMKARLAFAMLSHIDPEILIIDEALSVGDAAFSKKATAKIRQLCDKGKIVLVVSHSMPAINEICNRCIWIDHGRIVRAGAPGDVTEDYLSTVRAVDRQAAMARFGTRSGARSSRPGWHVTAELFQGEEPAAVLVSGDELRIRLQAQAPGAGDETPVDVTIVRLDGARVFAETLSLGSFGSPEAMDVELAMAPLVLAPSVYRLDVVLGGAEWAADASVMFEVESTALPPGGKPMLLYPLTLKVSAVAEFDA